MATNYSPLVVTNGISLCLDVVNPKSYSGSGATWSNIVNSASTFTLSGTPTYSSDGYLTFDGVDDHAVSSTSNFLKFENWTKLSFTMVFYHISATGAIGDRQYIMDFRTNGGSSGAFAFLASDLSTTRQLRLLYNTTGTSAEEPMISTYDLNTWNIYQLTFDRTSATDNVRHWLNGSNVYNRSIDASSTAANGDGNIWIGRYSGGSYHFNGRIAYISANIGTILTDEEIEQNYNVLRARFE